MNSPLSFPQTAIVREVSPSINDCELLFHARQPIDVTRAIAQHKAYQDCLAELGLRIVSLPAEPELPDAVFVEDPAVVLNEIAIISNLGAPSRQPEAKSLAKVLSHYRPLNFLAAPATLDGGDVLRVDRTLFVGLSRRTNRAGIDQLRDLLQPYDYHVQPIKVRGCLHLKSACSYIGNDTVLVNRSWIDVEPLSGFKLLDVPEEEPAAANALLLNGVVIIPKFISKSGSPGFPSHTQSLGGSRRKVWQKCQTPLLCSKNPSPARRARISRPNDRRLGITKSRSWRDLHQPDLQFGKHSSADFADLHRLRIGEFARLVVDVSRVLDAQLSMRAFRAKICENWLRNRWMITSPENLR